MEPAINYIFESSVCLGLFTLVYKIWLKKQPNLWYNRAYIIMALTVSALLPLLKFNVDWNLFRTTDAQNAEGAIGQMVLDSVTILGNGTTEKILAEFNQLQWLVIIYLTGIFVVAAKTTFALVRIRQIKRAGNNESKEGFILVDSNSDKVPFSFFNIVFVNRNQFEPDELQMVIDHELAHIRLKHSYDILLLELVLIFQWFNPFVWLLKRDLQELHEFQADLGTLQSGHGSQIYKALLVQKALGARVELAHSFNQSLIKKRLKMINSINKKPIGFWKPAVTVSLVALLAIGFGCEKNTQSSENWVAKSATLDAPPPPPIPNYSDSIVCEMPDVMPEFPGGQKAMFEHLSTNIKYPQEAIDKGLTGKVYVQFYVGKSGNIWVKGVVKSTNEIFNDAAIQAVYSMPVWKPGTKDGKPVVVLYTLPVQFALQ